MKDRNNLEVLLKVIKRIYDKNPGMQEMLDASMVEVCAEECESAEHVFFYFAVVIIIMATQEEGLSKSAEEIKNNL